MEYNDADYHARLSPGEYFAALAAEWGRISRGRDMLSQSEEQREASLRAARENRLALTDWQESLPEMAEYVPPAVVSAYRERVAGSNPEEDRSGRALMEALALRWEQVRRPERLIDPDDQFPCVAIEDLVRRGDKRNFKFSPLKGWATIADVNTEGIDDDGATATAEGKTMNAEQRERALRRLARRVFKGLVNRQLLDRKPKFLSTNSNTRLLQSADDVLLYLRSFSKSLELENIGFTSLVIGSSDSTSIEVKRAQDDFHAVFDNTVFGAHLKEEERSVQLVENISISDEFDVDEFLAKASRMYVKLAEKKGKTKKEPEPALEAGPDTVPDAKEDPTQQDKQQKPKVERRRLPPTREFLEAGAENHKRFKALLLAPPPSPFPAWNPQRYAARMRADELLLLAVRFRASVEERLWALRRAAMRKKLGYASEQPCYAQVPEFNKKYARASFKRIKIDDSLGEREVVASDDYERHEWVMIFGEKDIKNMNVAGLPRTLTEVFHDCDINAASMDITQFHLMLQWVFASCNDPQFLRFFMPEGDAISFAVDMKTETVTFSCRREGEFVTESVSLSKLFPKADPSRGRIGYSSDPEGCVFEWKLVHDDDIYEWEQACAKKAQFGWCVAHNQLDTAERWMQLLPNVNLRDLNGSTALHLACTMDLRDLVQKILLRKVDVNVADDKGNTALHICLEKGFFELAIVLLNHDADITIKNKENKDAFGMFSTKEQRSKFFLEQSFDLNTLKARAYSLWFYLIELRDLDEELLGQRVLHYVQVFATLAYAKDAHGRVAVDMATPHNKQIINSVFLWFGRYRVIETRPDHQSATCFVYRALDEDDKDEKGIPRQVALKLIRMKAHFQRELMVRRREFHGDHVVDIIARYPKLDRDLEHWPDDVSETTQRTDVLTGVTTKAQAEQFFCLVMPYANRNMFVALKQERFAGRNMDEVRHVFTQLVQCVAHVHERGVLHADLKTLNMVRMDTQWKLIDMDASCLIGSEPVGYKTSSAYLPPEAIVVDAAAGTVRARSCVRDARDEWLLAHPSFDVWSLGCVLYQMCNADVRPLFQGGQDDNLSTDPSEDDNLFALADWSPALKARKLQRVVEPLAKNLLSQLLQKDPRLRPSLSRILLHPFLSNKIAQKVIDEPSAVANERCFDVFLSYCRLSDWENAETVYELLTRRGLKVWWDEKCLPPRFQNLSEADRENLVIDGLMASRSFVCFLSPAAINNPDDESRCFAALSEDSPCNSMLLQQRLALELRSLGKISKIFPVMIGAKRVVPRNDETGEEEQVEFLNFFASKGNPVTKDIVVCAIEDELRVHMDRHAMGSPLEDSKTVRSVHSSVLACQGAIITGKASNAFDSTADTIAAMLSNSSDAENVNGDLMEDGNKEEQYTEDSAVNLLIQNDRMEINQLQRKLLAVQEIISKLQLQQQQRQTVQDSSMDDNTPRLETMRSLITQADAEIDLWAHNVQTYRDKLSVLKDENRQLQKALHP